MRIEVLQGPEASATLRNPVFQAAWQRLEAGCPWTTVYQTSRFLSVWYQAYSRQYHPVLICGWSDTQSLIGLFALARPAQGGALIIAGSYHAEYQVWLADPDQGDAFIEQAMNQLRDLRLSPSLMFTYLPPGAPVAWLAPGRSWSALAEHVRLPRPLATMGDGNSFKQSLKKKGNKSKISRLEKLGGKLRLEQVTDRSRLEGLFSEILGWGTFRIAALRNVGVLDEDPVKAPFYLELLAGTDLLHVTILWAGDQMLSAHVGIRDGNNVVLTIFTHAPFHARHSPGKIHLLLLGVMLAEQGVVALDLTPTGDYKDRFATGHDEVGQLQVFLTAAARSRYRAGLMSRNATKKLLRAFGKSPEEAKAAVKARLERMGRVRLIDVPVVLGRRVSRAIGYTRELRIYEFDVSEAAKLAPAGEMNRDRVRDVLAYQPVLPSEANLQAFLSDALQRLEEGQHIYTRLQDGMLAHHGWLIDRQERSFMTEVSQVLLMPPDSAVLYGFYTSSQARNRGYYQAALRQMLADAARIPGTRHIWISVLADNGPSRHTIEKAGFQYRFSFFEKKVLRTVRRWTTAPAEFVGTILAVPGPQAAEAVPAEGIVRPLDKLAC